MAKFRELMRWLGVSVGIFCAETWGQGAVDKFTWVCFWTVLPMAGLTAVGLLFYAHDAERTTGYRGGREFQVQSGLNLLALFIAAILVFAFDWGLYAQLTLMTVLLCFLCLSALNHLHSAVFHKNLSVINLLRPVLTALLLFFVIPYMTAALAAAHAG